MAAVSAGSPMFKAMYVELFGLGSIQSENVLKFLVFARFLHDGSYMMEFYFFTFSSYCNFFTTTTTTV